MKKNIICFSTIFYGLFIFSSYLFAWTPPAGTPLGDNVHPRIYLIPENSSYSNFGVKISEVRAKAVANSTYKGYLTDLLSLVDADYPLTASGSLGTLKLSTGAINFAFFYQLDLTGNPIVGVTPTYTTAQYGAKAKEWALYLANKMDCYTTFPRGGDSCGSNDNDEAWIAFNQYYYSKTEWDGPTSLSLSIVNDWCNNLFSDYERQLLFNGVRKAFLYAPGTESDMSGDMFTTGWTGSFLNSKHIGWIGFYGDSFGTTTYDNYIQEQADDFYTFWLDAQMITHERFAGHGQTSQGVGYDNRSLLEASRGIPAISSALNTNLYTSLGWLNGTPNVHIYNMLPMPDGGKGRTVPYNDTGYNENYVEWQYGKGKMFFNSIAYGLAKGGQQNLADMYKWYAEESGNPVGDDSYGDSDLLWRTVIFRLLFDTGEDALITGTPKPPSTLEAPLSKQLGNGLHSFRSGFESPDDTLITFVSKDYAHGISHHHLGDVGAFFIYKYGDLTTTRNFGKGFTVDSGEKIPTKFGMSYNTFAVYRPGEDTSNEFNMAGYKGGMDASSYASTDSVYTVGGQNHVGTSVSDLEGTHYDYVAYDYTNGSRSEKVSYAEREVVYLRSEGGGRDEYFITFDRVTATDASYEKRWLLQIPFEMDLLDENENIVNMTAETHQDDTDGGVHRWVSNTTEDNKILSINTYDRGISPDAHGRLYARPIWPINTKIVKNGSSNGTGLWVDAAGTTIATKASMSSSYKNYAGMFTAEIQPATTSSYDFMLNVMQFGDNDEIWDMTEMTRVSATGMAGVHIKDNTKNKIVMFSNMENAPVNDATAYNVTTTAPTFHLLCGMLPDASYPFNINGQVSTMTSNSAGIVSFETPAGQTTVSIDGGQVPPPPVPDQAFTIENISIE